jgi:hypothetical protein
MVGSPLAADGKRILGLIAAALLVFVLSATALVDGTRALSVSPTSPAIAHHVDRLARPAGQNLPQVTARR